MKSRNDHAISSVFPPPAARLDQCGRFTGVVDERASLPNIEAGWSVRPSGVPAQYGHRERNGHAHICEQSLDSAALFRWDDVEQDVDEREMPE